MDQFLNKKYNSYKAEGVVDLLVELGLDPARAAVVAEALETSVELQKKDDGTYVLNSVSNGVVSSQEFKPNVDIDHTRANGDIVIKKFTITGNTLTEMQIGTKTLKVVREFSGNEVVATATIGNVVSKSWYKA